jgi:dTDP-4-dehydrorhamnose reductase
MPACVEDLTSALRELAMSDQAGRFHLAGADALSRHQLGVLNARRDGLDATRLPAGRRADTRMPGALDVHLDSSATQ